MNKLIKKINNAVKIFSELKNNTNELKNILKIYNLD